MEVIRDCVGRVVCKGDAGSGLIEIKYRDLVVQAILTTGETYTIEREGIITTVTRTNDSHFSVSSRKKRLLHTTKAEYTN